ncbi:MAG: 50S ribosomal protein L9 [Chitinophagales bacterium]|nr:50S ribosomal protein L9 [Bacteroidota bacterium]MCB9256593.1 50S ribosomal protein L9 [Chitinophagales bacterium]
MEIILKKYHKGLGEKNDIVSVKPGFARNYLIPQGIAMIANTTNRKIHANHLKFKDKYEAKLIAEYTEIAAVLEKTVVNVGAKVGTTDKIFGSITTHHLAEAIEAQLGVEVDRKKITILGDEIKTTGEYSANVNLHEQVQATVKFMVVAE